MWRELHAELVALLLYSDSMNRSVNRSILLMLALVLSGCFTANPFDDDGTYSIRRNVGDSAFDLLSDADFDSLVVEVQPVSGYEPRQESLDRLKTFLEERLHKPGGITIEVNLAIAPPGKSSYSIEDVRSIEDRTRTRFPEGKRMTAYFLFLDGGSSEDSGSFKVLGHAYRNTSMVLYEKTIRDLTGGLGQPSRATVETTVLLHEFGHILGLVNNGTPLESAHHDSAHGAHCTNSNCLMYYAVNTSDFLSNLLGGNVPSLDSACLQDLQSNGGR